MHGVAFDHISPSSRELALPLEMHQSSSLSGSIGKLLVVLPAAAVLMVPFALICNHLLDTPEAMALFMNRPGSVLQIGLGLILWGLLFGLPLLHLLKGLGRARHVRIDGLFVHVEDRSLTGTTSWSEPLSNYSGLAHNVRTSMSSARHELVLIHRNRLRNVLVAVAERYSPQDVQHAAQLLGQSEVPSSGLYGSAGQRAWSGPARPMPLPA